MAQLTDDCFAFGSALLPVEQALALLRERLACVTRTESMQLAEAAGRVLAEDLHALHDVPPFFNSAVDGYALRHADLCGGTTRLVLGGRIAAGAQAAATLAPAQAARIFTGAPMPAGADTVLMQEDAVLDGGAVLVPPGLRPGANARPAGEDVASGEIILRAGRRLGPAELALAAACGHARLPVRQRLRVAVFSTGDELAEPGVALPAGGIHDSNRVMLTALLRGLGAAVTDLGILPDRHAAIAEALAAAAPVHDLLVTSGGVSTGEEDHVKAAVAAMGSLFFWRLAIKPGRPVALGQVSGTAFAGLPGNPAAVMTTFLHVLRPIALLLAGARAEPPLRMPVQAGFAYRKKPGRLEYVRAMLRVAEGGLVAEKFPREGAGLLSSLAQTDGLVELGLDATGVAPGDAVPFLPWKAML